MNPRCGKPRGLTRTIPNKVSCAAGRNPITGRPPDETPAEQQGKTVEELNALWYEGIWDAVHAQAKDLDELIDAFNEATGLLKAL